MFSTGSSSHIKVLPIQRVRDPLSATANTCADRERGKNSRRLLHTVPRTGEGTATRPRHTQRSTVVGTVSANACPASVAATAAATDPHERYGNYTPRVAMLSPPNRLPCAPPAVVTLFASGATSTTAAAAERHTRAHAARTRTHNARFRGGVGSRVSDRTVPRTPSLAHCRPPKPRAGRCTLSPITVAAAMHACRCRRHCRRRCSRHRR